MRLPLSPQTLFRLHRKLFMLRRPRSLARNAYCLTLTPGKKNPTVSLHVERRRGVTVGLLVVLLSALSAVLFWGRE